MIKITADSICDLTPELLKEYEIRQLPLTIVMNEQDYQDDGSISPLDIFNNLEQGHGASHTAAINVGEYLRVFQEELNKGADAIIHFTISGELSSCYENAVLAAQNFENVYPIDTRVLSTGSGWLVLYAAERAAGGVSAADLARECEDRIALSDTSFVIDTLEYLRQGGRCSTMTALGANLLNIHPCLDLRDGKIEVGKKYHGNIHKVVRQYIKDRLRDTGNLDLSRAFVTHTFFDEPEFVAEIVEEVKQLAPFEEVISTTAGCTISVHCGPKTLGVLFYHRQ